MEQAANTAEAAAVDHYFLLPAENISVPVFGTRKQTVL